MASTDLLTFAHIGDLHITTKDQANYADLETIVADINRLGGLDFVVLPGDNADDGLPEQYRLASEALAKLRPKLYVITGDHDMPKAKGSSTSSLASFYGCLAGTRPLPFSETIGGVRCLFLDMCGTGAGHLDFRLGQAQLQWLVREFENAKRGSRVAVFMHTYPDDLNDAREKAALIRGFADHEVLLVDIGHTHYNELANDGRTIYAATRSTGQIEEADGAAGYSIVTIDGTVVSWRFRTLGATGPMVLVTAPADRRLATRKADRDHYGHKDSVLRGTVRWNRPIESVAYSLDGASMVSQRVDAHRFRIPVDLTGVRSVVVEATDDCGITGTETIELARPADFARFREANGSDGDRIGRWIERGILGTQLGPNRNGRHW